MLFLSFDLSAIECIKTFGRADKEGSAKHNEAIYHLVIYYRVIDAFGPFAGVFIDRRVAVIGIGGGIEGIVVEPADSFSLPFVGIAFEGLWLARQRLRYGLAFQTLPIEDPRIGSDDIIMVLDQDILAVRGYIRSGDEMEAFVGLVLLAIAEVGTYAEIADIGQGLGLISVVEAEGHGEDLADIIIDLGDDKDRLGQVVIHQRLAVMLLAVGIYELDIARREGYLRRVDGIDSRFFEIDDGIVAVRLVVVAESAYEEVVRAVIHPAGHVLPIPPDGLGELDLAGTLGTFLVGGDDIIGALVALHPYISGCDTRAGDAGDLDDVFGDIQRAALGAFPVGVPSQSVAVIDELGCCLARG